MKENHATPYANNRLNDNGAVFIEFTIVVGLVLTIVYGLGQQYMKSLHNIEHYSLATEILMGPQDRSLAFDLEKGEVVALTDSTDPTLTHYMDTIGNFFKSRAPDESYGIALVLLHAHIDGEQGTITGVDNPADAQLFTYFSSPGNKCEANAETLRSWLRRYSNGRMKAAKGYADLTSPADLDDNSGRFGSKIYDIEQASVRIRSYEKLFPFLFAIICSETKSFGVSTHILSYHTIVPRRHIN